MIVVEGVRFAGPLEPYAQECAAELSRLGYPRASVEKKLRVVAQLSGWLAEQRMAARALTPQVAEEFMAARRTAGYRDHLTPASLASVLAYLRGLGVIGTCHVAELTPVDALLERYRGYLTDERGLADATVRWLVRWVRPFLAGRMVEGGLDLAGLTSGDIAEFVLEVSREPRARKAKATATSLRSFLRFLHVKGLVPSSLVGAVPSVATRRLAPLPRSLEQHDVSRLLSCCDRRTAAGRRDFAILLLLVRLGLRAGEVAGLMLDDLDWRVGELVVTGKGGRRERLPLPDEVGRAIVEYLQRGRPAGALERSVFVRVEAPHSPMTAGSVTGAVHRAGRRAGLEGVRAHQLRHTAASQMLAAGASLTEIGQLLRHSRTSTTSIYAKTDRDALRTVARPWPGGAA